MGFRGPDAAAPILNTKMHPIMALFENPVIAEHCTAVSHHFHHVAGGKTIS